MNNETIQKKALDTSKKYYNDKYHQYAKPPKDINIHYLKLADILSIRSNERVLDIACGTGEWLLAARRKGAIVKGIDISDIAIKACREGMPDGEFVVGPAETLPFSDESFDLVTCLGSLEHFVNRDAALAEMIRVGTPEARYIILVPNSGFLTRRLGFFSGTNQAGIKEDVLSLEEWREIFENAGLIIKQRWADLHILSLAWILKGPWHQWFIRLAQALLLIIWPLSWQYQVYHLCHKRKDSIDTAHL